jgi:hypothetical protein
MLTFCSSSIRGCPRSCLRRPFAHYSNLVLVIDSITGPDLLFIIHSFAVADLLFIIDSLTVADMRFLIKDSQDEKRERRSKKERERNEFIQSNRIPKALKAEDSRDE